MMKNKRGAVLHVLTKEARAEVLTMLDGKVAMADSQGAESVHPKSKRRVRTIMGQSKKMRLQVSLRAFELCFREAKTNLKQAR